MHKFLALTGAAAIALAGCNDNSGNSAEGGNAASNGTSASKASDTTLAQAVSGAGQFQQALKTAGLEATLEGPGPYTVLAPDDAAFGKLPPSALSGLKQPQAKPQLTAILTYHILPGTILTADLQKAIDNGGGKAVLATMAGKTLTATRSGDRITIADQAGRTVSITGQEQLAKNGVVHTVDGVLMPAKEALAAK
jgi:uncharacterized surface protein with fasciclin (FAS1) repeats